MKPAAGPIISHQVWFRPISIVRVTVAMVIISPLEELVDRWELRKGLAQRGMVLSGFWSRWKQSAIGI